MSENPRRGRQVRNFTTNAPKILDLKSSSEQMFSENWCWVPLTTEQSHCNSQIFNIILTFLAMHSGKSVFNLCRAHHILAITRQFISLQQGKNHSRKLRWPSFLMSQTKKFAAYCLLETSSQSAELGRDVIHHPPDGLSDCARSSVLWATSARLSLPGHFANRGNRISCQKLGSH